MLSRLTTRIVVFALLLSPALARQQLDVLWSVPLDDDPSTIHDVLRVVPTADGGCIAFDLRSSTVGGTPTVLAILRMGKDGDIDWQSSISRSSSMEESEQFDAGPDGSAVLLQVRTLSLRLTRIDPSGSIAFDRVITPALGTAGRTGQNSVRITPNGDVVMLTVEPMGTTSRVVLRRFDPTGAPLFETVYLAESGHQFTAPPYLATVGDDALFPLREIDPAISSTTPVPRIRRVGPAGNEVWADSVDLASANPFPRFQGFDSNSSGTTMLHVSPVQGSNVIIVTDGDGQRIYEQDTALFGFRGRISESNEVYLDELVKHDSTGAVVWQNPDLTDYITTVDGLDSNGSPVVSGRLFIGANQVPVFSGIDPTTGNLAWSWAALPYSFSSIGTTPLAPNDRGELFFASVPGLGQASLQKLAPLARIGQPLCDAPVPNATGRAGELVVIGSTDVADGRLTLLARELPAGAACLFLASRDMTPFGVPVPVMGSSGTLCLGSSIGRFAGPGEIRIADGLGFASLQLDLSSIPEGATTAAILPGDTWHFQAWHREPPTAVRPSNLTGATTVLF